MRFTRFYWVLLGFAQFYWVLLGFTGLYWVLLDFTGFYWVLPGFHWVSLKFLSRPLFYRVPRCFTGFQYDLIGCLWKRTVFRWFDEDEKKKKEAKEIHEDLLGIGGFLYFRWNRVSLGLTGF